MKVFKTIDRSEFIVGYQIYMTRPEAECLVEDLLGGTMGSSTWELKEQLEGYLESGGLKDPELAG